MDFLRALKPPCELAKHVAEISLADSLRACFCICIARRYLFIKKLPPLEQCVQFPRTILLPPKTRRAPRITLVRPSFVAPCSNPETASVNKRVSGICQVFLRRR